MRCRVIYLFIYLLLPSSLLLAQQKQFLYKVIDHNTGLQSKVALGTIQDSRGLVWIFAYDGIYTYDGFRATRQTVKNCDTCEASNDLIYGLLEPHPGKYWMLTGKGIGTFQPLTGVFTLVKPIPDIIWCNWMDIVNDSCIGIYGCSRSALTFNMYNHELKVESGDINDLDLKLIKNQERIVSGFPVLKNEFGGERMLSFRGHLDLSDNLWFVTKGGLFHLEKGSNAIRSIGDQYPIFSGANINNSRIDSLGILWLTIQGKGVVMLDTKGSGFNALTSQTRPTSLIKDFVIGIIPLGDDKIAVYPQFDRAGKATILNTNDLSAQIKEGPALGFQVRQAERLPIGWSADQLNKMFSEIPGNLLAYTKDIDAFLGKNGKYYYLSIPGLNLSIWPDQKLLFTGFSIICHRYIGDTLWFGTETHGLVAIDLNTSEVSTLRPGMNGGDQINSWTVFGILADGPEYLWLATSSGLWHLNKKNGTFTGYKTNEGLPNAYVYCLTKALDGKLWLGTGNGLSCFDPQTERFRNYFPADGLVNIEYNRNSAYTAKDGRVFMGGSNGVDYFYPDQIRTEKITAEPFFSAVYYHNQPLDPTGKVYLKADQNSLTFFLGVDEPFKADSYRYQWKLEGSDDDWAEVGSSRILNLANLKANNYTLRVRLVDPNGTFLSKEAAFSFSIAPYWYDTWAFRIMSVLAATGMLSAILFYRQRQKLRGLRQENIIMRLKAKQEALLREERERITADLHDDAGATLSSIYIYSDIANRMWDEKPQETRDLLGKMAEASRDMMQKMNDIIWSLKPAEEEKNALRLRLANFCLDLFGNTDTQVHFDMDEDLDTLIDHASTRKNLLLIAKESLNNAAKCSEAKNVWVSLKREKGEAILSIRDDGKGFEASTPKGGNGLENMRRRAEQMQAIFQLVAQHGAGVTITVRLPITTTSY